MAQWHLDDLDNALTKAGWRIAASHPGDGERISGSWEVERSTKHPPVIIDFVGFDDLICFPIEKAYACHVREMPRISMYFGKRSSRWEAGVESFVACLDLPYRPFALLFESISHGSAIVDVWANGTHAAFPVSYISPDPLGELAGGVARVLTAGGPGRISSDWADEPGSYHWVVESDGTTAAVYLLHYESYSPRQDERNGKLVLETSCLLLDLARGLNTELKRLVACYGPEEYERRWQRPFPTNALTAISAAIEMHMKAS